MILEMDRVRSNIISNISKFLFWLVLCEVYVIIIIIIVQQYYEEKNVRRNIIRKNIISHLKAILMNLNNEIFPNDHKFSEQLCWSFKHIKYSRVDGRHLCPEHSGKISILESDKLRRSIDWKLRNHLPISTEYLIFIPIQ